MALLFSGKCYQFIKEKPMQFNPEIKNFGQMLDQVNIQTYETSRNYLTGSVTHLSPYISHGFETMPNIVTQLKRKHGLTPQHKLYAELGWREYYYHVWGHLGDDILQDIRPPLQDVNYQDTMPEDVLQMNTGLAPIDLAISELYENGYLHNHARMWLASYLIHFRKIHWRTCADWMYGYLLDGDLASNHLSWQWVASTFSNKPYLFNAENVAKFAPPEWHCSGSLLDQSYDALEVIARSNQTFKKNSLKPQSKQEIPLLQSRPSDALLKKYSVMTDLKQFEMTKSNQLRLIHPWHLKAKSDEKFQLGIIHLTFHEKFPWSEKRWDFVLNRMSQLCDVIVLGDLEEILLPFFSKRSTMRIDVQNTFNPEYAILLDELTKTNDTVIHPIERFLADPEIFCPSFTKFWQIVTKKEKFPQP